MRGENLAERKDGEKCQVINLGSKSDKSAQLEDKNIVNSV